MRPRQLGQTLAPPLGLVHSRVDLDPTREEHRLEPVLRPNHIPDREPIGAHRIPQSGQVLRSLVDDASEWLPSAAPPPAPRRRASRPWGPSAPVAPPPP